MRLGASAAAALLVIATSACGPTPVTDLPGSAPVRASPPVVPAHALDGPSTPLEPLGAGDLAEEAAEVGSLRAETVATELRETRFIAGSARSFAIRGLRVRSVRARVLRFAAVDGAQRYLDWMWTHAGSLLGDGTVMDGAALRRPGFVFVHEPTGCCAKDQAVAVGVWRHGPFVLSVTAIGAVDGSDAVRYAIALDGAV